MKDGWYVPLIYVLAVDKRYETYKMILEQLVILRPNFKPHHITIDFEKAVIKALNEIFPDSNIHGCNFHFAQSVWRHLQSVGLQRIYSEDSDFGLNIRLLLALPFVPENDVEYAFSKIVQSDFYIENEDSEYNDSIQALLNYIESTYIGRFNRTGIRKPGLFPIELWNVYELTLNGIVVFFFSHYVQYFHNSFSKSKYQVCHEQTTMLKVGIMHYVYLSAKIIPIFINLLPTFEMNKEFKK